jgi:hypothetical protein
MVDVQQGELRNGHPRWHAGWGPQCPERAARPGEAADDDLVLGERIAEGLVEEPDAGEPWEGEQLGELLVDGECMARRCCVLAGVQRRLGPCTNLGCWV